MTGRLEGKVAIITGISGQDGSYLAELLIKKKYKVYGIFNPKKKIDYSNLYRIRRKLLFKKIDINNYNKIKSLIKNIKPTEFYHLAAQSFINYRFEDEFFKLNPNINGTHYILSAIKEFSPKNLTNKNKSQDILKFAVKRMLPGGPLAKKQLSKLKIYYGDKHPHSTQNPVEIKFSELSKKNQIKI